MSTELLKRLAGLSPEQRRALEARVRGARPAPGALAALPRPEGAAAEFPLSFAQQRLWVLDRMEPGTGLYNLPITLRIRGALDVAALERAFDALRRRHESLRTTFAERDGRAVQVVHPAGHRPLEVEDLSHLTWEQAFAHYDREMHSEAHAGFDLQRGPLFRVRLLVLAPGEFAVIGCMHHIVGDGWSSGVIVRELGALYGAFANGQADPLPPPPLQYADFAAWQRERLSGDALERQLAFWRGALGDAPPALELPTDRPRPARWSGRGDHLSVTISPQVTAGLHALALREGTTLFCVLLAAWRAVLGRHAGAEDLVVGTPVAGRTRRELEPLVGFFVNTLPLRASLAGDPPFRALVAREREALLEAMAHQELPFERIVEALSLPRDLGRNPVFQASFSLLNMEQNELRMAGVEVLPDDPLAFEFAKFDLTLDALERDGGVGASIEWATDLYDRATAERLLHHWRGLLARVADAPGAPLSALLALDAGERARVLAWGGRADAPAPATVHAAFEAHAARAPGATALVWADGEMAYAELDARASAVARRLVAAGVRMGDAVAVLAEHSPHAVAALLGVMKAGGAYLPMDAAHPDERIAFTLDDARPAAVLAQPHLAARIPSTESPVLLLDDAVDADAGTALPEVDPASLSYVLYTSGSTGTPKPVGVTHAAAAAHLASAAARYGLRADDRVLAFAALTFDPSLEQILAPLGVGASVALRGADVPSPAEMAEAVRRMGITVLNPPTAYWHPLVDDAAAASAVKRSARLVIAGGEAMRPDAAARWLELSGDAVLLNAYGPTEAVVTATAWEVDGGADAARLPVGAPLPGRVVRVLDARGEPVPAGVPGELYLGGPALALGYLRRPALTAAAFVPDAFAEAPGARLYRTGDRARWRADGTLEYLGRVDAQVKIRGFRIEPGEVEAAVRAHPAVRDAAVVARGEGADRRLVAYVAGDAPVEDVRAFVRGRLPEHMVPAAWVAMDALPLTPGGKVDRRGLPEPEAAASTGGAAPRTPAEEVVAGIWERVLGVRPGVHDSFFDLGGHSLRATQVVSRIGEAFGIDLPLRALFEEPTVAGLAARAARARAGGAAAPPPLVPVPRGEDIPLSFAQQRFWFVEQMGAASNAYIIPASIRLRGALDADALHRALDALVARHEPLRTVFRMRGGQPVQVIHPHLHLPLPLHDLSGLDEGAADAEALRITDAEVRTLFDLANGPVIRARLIRHRADDHTLLLSLHHIVADAWSVDILFRELQALYAAERDGTDARLPALAVQYADYALWQRERMRGESLERQLAYWRGALAGAPTLPLPTDRPHPPVQSFRGGNHRFALSPELSAGVAELARASGATTYMALLAAYALLLSRWSGTDDVVVGSPVAGRTPRETEPLIGIFLNTLALRTDLSGDPTFRELLGRVRAATIDAFAHQEVPLERLMEELKVERSLSRHPLFQVVFSLVPAGGSGDEVFADLAMEVTEPAVGAAKVDLTLAMGEFDGQLFGNLQYASDLFDEATVARMGGHLRTLLAAAVADPGARLSSLPMLGDDERALVIDEWNRTDAALDPAPVHAQVAARAARQPDAPAVAAPDAALSYAELDARAGRLAARLRAMGVGPDTRVAVMLERGAALVIAQLAVLKAGGAYVPLDPAGPADRAAYMLQASGAIAALTRAGLRTRIPSIGLPIVLVDEADADAHADAVQPPPAVLGEVGEVYEPGGGAPHSVSLDGASASAEAAVQPPPGFFGGGGEPKRAGGGAAELAASANPASLAYVIFTSGSTGQPKGVAVPHAGLSNLAGWHRAAFALAPGDRAMLIASPAFDASAWETWSALAAGAALHVPPDALRTDPAALLRWMDGERITVAFLPTPAAEAALEAMERGATRPRALRTLLTGGDALRRRAPAGLRLVNAYGPTENAVVSTAGDVAGEGAALPPIGRPVANHRAYVLDARLRPVPPGVPGELHVAGAGLARGYLGRPGMTAETFIPCPFAGQGARMYATGDRVRWLATGELEYLGRTDAQVKLRGHRIETGEIESALLAHPAVAQAAVVLRADGGDARLVAYVAAASGAPAPSSAELRAHLRERLPDYMLPAAWVTMDAIPLSPNGKVDRKALPAPAAEPRTAALPASALERRIAKVWEQVLGIERIGVDDNFFEVGGHSMLVARMQEALREAVGREVSVVELFQYPTVGALAAHLDARDSADGAAPPPQAAQATERGASRREMMRRQRGR